MHYTISKLHVLGARLLGVSLKVGVQTLHSSERSPGFGVSSPLRVPAVGLGFMAKLCPSLYDLL